MGIRVLIVDDHRLFSDVIAAALTARGVEIVAQADTCRDALRAAQEHAPDIVLLDIELPDGSGVDAGRSILHAHPGVKVMAVTAMNDARLVTETMRAGFHGYLTKGTPLTQLIAAIEAALDGQVVVPHRLAAGSAGVKTEEERRVQLLANQLTPREIEVLGLLVEGLTSAELASRLQVSPNTVRTHIQSVLSKLQVHSRLQAATFAVRHRICKPQPRTS